MRKLCIALTVALGGAFVLPLDPAEALPRHHHVGKHHHVTKKKFTRHTKRRAVHSVSLAGVTPVLAAKARRIAASCGSAIISGVSRRARRSNHPIGRAVDMKGNPGCIYAHLKGWPGGYSTDYAAAGHVHISYNPGGQEWGLRFAHGGTRRARVTRVARTHSRKARVAEFAYSSSRKSRTVRYSRRGASHYAMQPAIFAPTKHSVH